MMRASFLIVLVAISVSPLAGQQGPARRQELQRAVMQRMMQNFRTQAGLTDAQFAEFQEVFRSSFEERRGVQTRQRQLLRALEGQLRPGVAADADSVEVLLADVMAVRQEMVDIGRREQERMAEFLTPVQRAMMVMTMERLQRQIEGVMRRRGPGNAGPRRPGDGGGVGWENPPV